MSSCFGRVGSSPYSAEDEAYTTRFTLESLAACKTFSVAVTFALCDVSGSITDLSRKCLKAFGRRSNRQQ